LCKQDDEAAMAEGILAIISDPKKRTAMSKESLAIAQTHDLETTLNLFEKIYTDLINA